LIGRDDRDGGPAVGLALCALLVASLQILGFHGLRHDDAYITYRYGQNLASGQGLVFNPGQRIMGSTSPGQALVAALVYRLVGQAWLPSVMSSLGCLGWTSQAVAVLVLVRRASGWGLAILVGLGVAAGAAGSPAWVALETNLATGFTLWAMVAALASRWRASAACCALAGLMRPDAYLVLAPLGILGWRDLGRAVWRPAVVFVGLSAPWVLFAAWYFGSPLPQSALAKFHGVSAWGYATHVVQYLPSPMLQGVPGVGSVRIAGQYPALPVLALMWGLAVLGGVVLTRGDGRLWVIPAYGALHVAAYVYLRPFLVYDWHLYPAALVFAVSVLAALTGVARAAPPLLRATLFGVVVLVLVWVAGRTTTFALAHPSQYAFGARDAVYRGVADHLGRHSAPSDLAATVEPGTIAYYSQRAIYDLAGLVTRDPRPVFQHLENGKRGIAANAPAELRWLVLDERYLRQVEVVGSFRVFRRGDFVVYVVDLHPPGR
jgi:arabinofuranosyltransferase